MRLLLFISVLMTFAAAKAAPLTHPFFYKVEKDGRSSYLLGTFHRGVPAADLPAPILDLMLKSERVFFEANPEDVDLSFELELLKRSVLPDSVLLSQLIPAATYSRLREILGPRVPRDLDKYQPWAIGLYLKSLLTRSLPMADASMDLELYDRAVAKRRTVQYLERTTDYLNDIPNQFSPADLADLLGQNDLKNFEETCASELLEAYSSGNENRLLKVHESACQTTGFRKSVERRSLAWMPILLNAFVDRSTFVAVGAAHLIGPRGLLEQLRARGYRVTRP